MATYSHEEPLPMHEFNQPRQVAKRSASFNQEYHETRPNRVISGHRRIQTLYTGPRSSFENHANKIVAKMEENRVLMEDTMLSEQLRKEALRELPQCLTMKKCVKMKLSKSVSQRSKRKPIGFWKRFKYRTSINFSKLKYKIKNFNYFELWHGTLKDIEGHFGSGYASYFKFLRWLFVMNCFISTVSFSMLAIPQIIYDSSDANGTIANNQSFQLGHIFTGIGFFNETVLYYGHYTDSNLNLIPHLFYDMPAAYFSVIVALYLISFIILAVSVAQSYHRTFIETAGGLHNIFANKVLCGWDYGIATKEAAELQSSALYNELKELLSESRRAKVNSSCFSKFCTCIAHIFVNVLILILLGLIGWACWALLDQFALKEDMSIIVTTVVVNIIMVIFPVIFNYISKYEGYTGPRTALYVTLIRTYLLGVAIIGVILAFWIRRAAENKTDECWENCLAAEIYRLILFDFLFSVVLTAVVEIAYSLFLRFQGENPKSEFNVPRHTLQIIYNQALFWVAFFYSPILPLLVTLKMFLIWYLREMSVRNFCKPPKRIWKAAQAQTLFMTLIFISIILIIAAHGYTLTTISSSQCGPFKNYEYIYSIVTNNIENLESNSTPWKIIMMITKPGTVALIMIGLAILVYYFKEQAEAQKGKVSMLREMLAWMGKDKKYLVCLYNDVTKGQSEINFRDNSLIDVSKVLPHEVEDYPDFHGPGANLVSEDDFDARFKKYS